MPTIRIRPAQASDRADVEAICADIWDESDDYVPEMWDEWLADGSGRLVVAEMASRISGLAKLTHLSGDEWWLEGLRVRPEDQRRGVASQLQAHLVDAFRRTERGILRFATHSENHPVHHLAARDGFRHVATYRLYESEPVIPDPFRLPRCLNHADLAAAWDLVEGSPRYRAAAGLYETFWAWETLTRERLAQHVSRGGVWGLDGEGELAAVAVLCETDKDDAIDLGYVDGRRDGMRTLLLGIMGLAAQQGLDKMRFRAVDEPELVAAVESAGYASGWDRDLWIFELAPRERGEPPSPRADSVASAGDWQPNSGMNVK